MAYKFQTLAAKMSGSLTQEGDFAVHDHSGAEKATIGIDGAVSGSGALSAGGNLRTAGTVRFDGVAQAAVAVSADSILFFDADDNLVKKEAVGDFAADLAGTGLEEDSDTIAPLPAVGDGSAGGGGSALSVAVSGAIHVSGDKVSLTGSLAGDCLDKGSTDGVDSIAVLHVVADESTIESAGRASLRIKDDGVTGAKLAPAVAGNGLAQDGSGNLDVGAATNGGIAVNANDIGLDLNDLSAGTIASGDSLAFVDANDSNNSKKETVDDLATLFAGDGLSAASAVLSVAVSGAVKVASDKVGLTGSIAGDALDFAGGADSLSTLHVVADESTIESAGRASLRIKDDGVTGAKLAPAVAGNGLAQDGSGNLDVGAATNGGIAVNANDIGLDLNDLSAATVNVGADSIAIVDADDSNNSKKESIADFVAAIAGSGLAASSGVLSTQAGAVAAKADGDTLAEGYNIFADLSSNATVTLPSGSLGDVVVIKARNLTSGANIIVNPSGSQAIDGLTGAGAIRLESPFGAVTLVYAQANDWRRIIHHNLFGCYFGCPRKGASFFTNYLYLRFK